MLAALADGREATSSQLRDEIPLLQGSIAYGEGKSWGGPVPIGPRVLTTLSAAGLIVRASNDGGWTTSRPRWASTEPGWASRSRPFPKPRAWRGWSSAGCGRSAPARRPTSSGGWGRPWARCARRWPTCEAVEVDLDGQTGYLLPDDLEATDPVEPWAALLPPLDPTTMGWSQRDWYLGPHKAQLFDTSGNAGPTLWWEGRIVGGWRQGDSGEVVLQLLDDIGADGVRALEREAACLTAWLDGARVLPRFPSPLFKADRGRIIARLTASPASPPRTPHPSATGETAGSVNALAANTSSAPGTGSSEGRARAATPCRPRTRATETWGRNGRSSGT